MFKIESSFEEAWWYCSVSTSSTTVFCLTIVLVYYVCHIIRKCKTRRVVEVVVTMCKAKASRRSKAKIYCLT